ncbi:alkyl hydroperoxide reductase AhpD [Alcaligenes pakistanensis]|uniref:Alkyl hydroperoxide reductase AhpD n=1 Tax=Alcaligenes pakistanensis TaxID=1482717 RepID=A0A8H9M9T3_9BURK|nr:carboxymuconolactone decarboxylase family protein [Alcaligenes pakistanensis]MBP6620796.1 carboxymuconolactone decarboxylase family protein [Alcaligenes sp.]GHC55943.1 alkyl hydroperoxide reductase AhpD [Alcaligenes pakistanensis]HCA18525.1 carboxymuconolactone decarboxylase family protein [Alcaligenes faecalis]
MTRLTLHTVDSAPDAVKPALEKAVRGSGFLSNLLAVLANAPVALQAYQDMSALNATASLSLIEREVVQLVAGTTHGCRFCVAGHTAIATNKAKLDPEILAALRARGFDQINDERLQALALFSRAVIDTRGQVSDQALADFRAAGYGDQQALEVITGIGLATICNFANNLAQTPLNSQLEAYAWETP